MAEGGVLDTIQEGFHVRLGSKCGFCTPGMIMAARALLSANSEPTLEQIKAGLANNLCRCTGYNTIIESVQFAMEKRRAPEGGRIRKDSFMRQVESQHIRTMCPMNCHRRSAA